MSSELMKSIFSDKKIDEVNSYGMAIGDLANGYLFVQNQPVSSFDLLGLRSVCDGLTPGTPDYSYVWHGEHCVDRRCLVFACESAMRCLKDAANDVWGNVGLCVPGCLPALVFGPTGYGTCLAACFGGDFGIQISSCLDTYNKQKKLCRVKKDKCCGSPF
jgi:hypothetical protein